MNPYFPGEPKHRGPLPRPPGTLTKFVASDHRCDLDFGWEGSMLLPQFWRERSVPERFEVLRYLQKKIPGAPKWWFDAHPHARLAVVKHLRRALHRAGMSSERDWPAYGVYVPVVDEASPFGGYVRPNGGKRILPAAYSRLTEYWITSTGEVLDPRNMRTGHLANAIALLEESHRNLVARANSVLERLHAHANNSARAQVALVEANRYFHEGAVEGVYPVIVALRRALDGRRAADLDAEWHMSDDSIPFGRMR